MIQMVWAIIISVLPWAVSSIFKAIGLAFVTFIGVTVVIDQGMDFIFREFDNIGGELLQILILAGVPDGITILFSAFAAALFLKHAGQRNPRRQVWRKPGDNSDFQWPA